MSAKIDDVIPVLDIVLREGWQENLLKPQFQDDPLSFIDDEKLSKLTNEFVNQLLRRPCFSEPQRSYIREKRRKYLSSRAAKRHRDGEKEKLADMEKEIDEMKTEKEKLKMEVEELLNEIHMYQEEGVKVQLT